MNSYKQVSISSSILLFLIVGPCELNSSTSKYSNGFARKQIGLLFSPLGDRVRTCYFVLSLQHCLLSRVCRAILELVEQRVL